VEKSYIKLYGGSEFKAIKALPTQALAAAWERPVAEAVITSGLIPLL
jgi:hypothetical protein